jgi:hypothetical protein
LTPGPGLIGEQKENIISDWEQLAEGLGACTEKIPNVESPAGALQAAVNRIDNGHQLTNNRKIPKNGGGKYNILGFQVRKSKMLYFKMRKMLLNRT